VHVKKARGGRIYLQSVEDQVVKETPHLGAVAARLAKATDDACASAASGARTLSKRTTARPISRMGTSVRMAGGESLADPKVRDNHARRISMKIVRRRFVLKITDS
jgi:hypothetical protein